MQGDARPIAPRKADPERPTAIPRNVPGIAETIECSNSSHRKPSVLRSAAAAGRFLPPVAGNQARLRLVLPGGSLRLHEINHLELAYLLLV
ncbi:hypothetical protein BMJ29_36085 [Sinorhizobium medicae]|uniref:Uncharacterized protein n=1 Tax=Sinorhizobium medicae TaxID=110321 RepID=A0ABX4TKT8_9HYPH|nr:hypothetical protein BMJ33_14555 [Sinorhizobium medicae]PLU10942.1 hypothetical protein BMJ29_36085 [Sinorhizobium medicae]PLU32043.1 hypothetical protein BMJ26_28115 [Sinorhizobium medicae]PLU49975.1 hypothetical protein BMJ25_08070 [Sinorhizobium medicae]PLU79221.1 hypothetical protein BMJ19_14075 [Sinorhizobium medicae]